VFRFLPEIDNFDLPKLSPAGTLADCRMTSGKAIPHAFPQVTRYSWDVVSWNAAHDRRQSDTYLLSVS